MPSRILASADVQAIGVALRRWREDIVLTQAEFASKLGIDQATLSRYEAGKQGMSVDVLYAMALALHVPVCCVIMLANTPKSDPATIRAAVRLARLALTLTPRRRNAIIGVAEVANGNGNGRGRPAAAKPAPKRRRPR